MTQNNPAPKRGGGGSRSRGNKLSGKGMGEQLGGLVTILTALAAAMPAFSKASNGGGNARGGRRTKKQIMGNGRGGQATDADKTKSVNPPKSPRATRAGKPAQTQNAGPMQASMQASCKPHAGQDLRQAMHTLQDALSAATEAVHVVLAVLDAEDAEAAQVQAAAGEGQLQGAADPHAPVEGTEQAAQPGGEVSAATEAAAATQCEAKGAASQATKPAKPARAPRAAPAPRQRNQPAAPKEPEAPAPPKPQGRKAKAAAARAAKAAKATQADAIKPTLPPTDATPKASVRARAKSPNMVAATFALMQAMVVSAVKATTPTQQHDDGHAERQQQQPASTLQPAALAFTPSSTAKSIAREEDPSPAFHTPGPSSTVRGPGWTSPKASRNHSHEPSRADLVRSVAMLGASPPTLELQNSYAQVVATASAQVNSPPGQWGKQPAPAPAPCTRTMRPGTAAATAVSHATALARARPGKDHSHLNKPAVRVPSTLGGAQ
jgi:hypothetical protein